MPDYIGMGDSPGFHPYVHAKSEATASIDMVRAAREYLSTTNFVDNNELFLTGYFTRRACLYGYHQIY